jgi:hypothetical protein
MLRCTRRSTPRFFAVVCALSMLALSGCMDVPRCNPVLPDGGASGFNLDCTPSDAGATDGGSTDAGATDGGTCDGGAADGGC